MNFDEYSEKAWSTADYSGMNRVLSEGDSIVHPALMYPALKLAGEAGEFTELLGKTIRDEGGLLTLEFRLKAAKELGDVLWYVNANALKLGYTLEQIATINLAKLADRKNRNMIHGNGDDR